MKEGEENKEKEVEHGPTAATSTDRTSAGNVTTDGPGEDNPPTVIAPEPATATSRARGGKGKGKGKIEAVGGKEEIVAEKPEDANLVAKQQREGQTGVEETPHEHFMPHPPPVGGIAAAPRTAATTEKTIAPGPKAPVVAAPNKAAKPGKGDKTLANLRGGKGGGGKKGGNRK